MTKKMRDQNEGTESEYIEGDIVKVRMSGPADKGRTITVPGNAPLDEIKRRAYIVTSHVTDYDFYRVGYINGRGLRVDGSLYNETHPGYEVEAEE